MKILIIGGVAGGATTAARLRRNDENATIIMVERGEHISYANCGLPYYIGGTIAERESLFVQTPEAYGRPRVRYSCAFARFWPSPAQEIVGRRGRCWLQ